MGKVIVNLDTIVDEVVSANVGVQQTIDAKNYVLNTVNTIDTTVENKKTELENYSDSLVASGTAAYDSNATNRIGQYDSNHEDKLSVYNDNNTTKLNQYNANHNERLTVLNDQYANRIVDMLNTKRLLGMVDQYVAEVTTQTAKFLSTDSVNYQYYKNGVGLVENVDYTVFDNETIELVDPITPNDVIIQFDAKLVSDLVAAQGAVLEDRIGAANGVASLDENALIPASQLPSYVDDVIEVAAYADLPVTGEIGKIYVVVVDETNGNDTSSYRWSGSAYAMVSNTLTAADIESLYEGIADTNKYTDDEKVRVANIPTDTITELANKQETLISGTNIKSINGVNILGSGNAAIPTGSGGYAGNIYLTELVSATNAAYNQISYTPDATTTTKSAVVNNNRVLIDSYIYDSDVDADSIPAGEWGFHLHRWVSNSAQDTRIEFVPFKRTAGGVETELATVSTLSIDDVVSTRETVLITLGVFATNPTDRVGIKVYAVTTRTSDTTVYLQSGDGEATFFTTPLQVRHNLTRARDEADSHPIGAITGLETELAGKADNATTLAGYGVIDADTSAEVDAKVDTRIAVTEKGAALGVAELNALGHVPESQLATGGGDATKYLRGDGLWSAVASGGGLGAIPFYRADGSRDDINIEALQTLIALTVQDQLDFGNNANIFVGGQFGWSDLKGTITTGGGITEPTLTTFIGGIKLPAFASNKMNEFTMPPHLNHDYAPGTKLYPHIHFAVNSTQTGTVRWGFEFTVAAGHHQPGTISVFNATNTVYIEQVIDGTANKHYVSEVTDANAIGAIAADLAKLEPDTIVLVRVFRDALHPNDTFNDDAFGITADLHQQVGRFSTKNRTPNFYN